MMLDHCTYDRVKLLHELSSMVWFIEKHGKQDAKTMGELTYHDLLEQLAQDLEKHIQKLKEITIK